jgi:hypothetical protein
MLDEKLQMRIDLLQEQIDNLEKSGHYTDAEIEIQTKPLKIELALIKDSLAFEFLTMEELRELNTRIVNAIWRKNHTGNGFVVKVSGILVSLKKEASNFVFPNKYGMSDEEYQQGKKLHDAIFAPIKALEIEVIDAEILTPNYQEA